MRKYVFVDPSGSFNEGKGHTAIATMLDDDWTSLTTQTVAAKDYTSQFDYWRGIINAVFDEFITGDVENIVIIESFMIRNNGYLIGKMPETILFIGALIHQLDCVKIKYIFQTPTQAKSRFKDEALSKYIPNFEKRSNGRAFPCK